MTLFFKALEYGRIVPEKFNTWKLPFTFLFDIFSLGKILFIKVTFYLFDIFSLGKFLFLKVTIYLLIRIVCFDGMLFQICSQKYFTLCYPRYFEILFVTFRFPMSYFIIFSLKILFELKAKVNRCWDIPPIMLSKFILGNFEFILPNFLL